MTNNEAPKASRLRGLLRMLSILAASTAVLLVIIYPRAIATDSASVPHGWFALMMMGMSICWINGFGFTPRNRCFKILFSLPVGWLMLLTGAWQIFS